MWGPASGMEGRSSWMSSTFIIGAGGAAKAIYYTFLSMGMKQMDICNRSIGNAEELIQRMPL